MTKATLIQSVYERFDGELTKRLVGDVIETVFEQITLIIKKKERFAYIGFGTFVLRKRKPRKARNPRTGETIRTKASKSIGFKASRILRKRM